MVANKLLPFDAHNHVQLGPLPVRPATGAIAQEYESTRNHIVGNLSNYILEELHQKHLSGMAVMATHPRDFATILGLEKEIHLKQQPNENHENIADKLKFVPCLGVHPWFLHELDTDNDWELVPSSSNTEELVPKWTVELEELLKQHPQAPVGEIGLDGFHFRSDGDSKVLTTPMDDQVDAFVLQLKLATRLRRPVSVHCVRAMGKLMEALEEVATENYEALAAVAAEEWKEENQQNELFVLPPRIYFHAFGGKASTVSQLIKTLEKPRRIKLSPCANGSKRNKFVKICPPKVYFGFAPPVNFQSPKTPSVIKAVGLERLVIETDREDIQLVRPDCEESVSWMASVLEVSTEELVSVTNANAQDLYYSHN